MAISDDDLDLDDKADSEEKPSKSKKTIIIIVAAVLVLGITTGAALYFTGVIGGGEDAGTETSEDGVADESDDKSSEEEELASEVIYHKFKPAFVVNFEDKGKLRYLQIDLSVATKKPSIIDELIKHEPVIRNNLVLLYSSKTADELNSQQGKEKLRQQTLEEIQKIMKENVGNNGIDEAYFTGFVVQ